MTDYKNGKIYVIKSKETNEVYIGSTCNTLLNRFSSHKSAYKRKLKGEIFKSSCSYKILKYVDAYIELIELCPCETKRQLLDREGDITKNTPNCINVIIQGRTMSQYRIDNAVKLKQQSKDYRTNNSELKKKQFDDWYKSDKGKAYHEKKKLLVKVNVICPNCSKEMLKNNLSRHMKIHIK